MKKALIFDPYLDTLGGGERYTLSFSLGLIKLGYSVEIAWSDATTLTKATERFGLDFSEIVINPSAYDKCKNKSSLLERYLFTREYDLIFWVSDGSLPFLFGRNNLIHLQVPFLNIGKGAFSNMLKSQFVNKFVYNSEFTRDVYKKSLDPKKGFVLYPPIDVDSFKPGKKTDIILSVARFGSPSHSKRQDVLIEAFKKLNLETPEYKLILTGGVMINSSDPERLKIQAKGLPVEIITNPDFEKLKLLYANAKFFWHAAGYGIDEQKNPEKVEHFGMTTVEAMSAGCVPVVISKGGQKEIVTSKSGCLCNDDTDMANKTMSLINKPREIEAMSALAIQRSKLFSMSEFQKKLTSLIVSDK